MTVSCSAAVRTRFTRGIGARAPASSDRANSPFSSSVTDSRAGSKARDRAGGNRRREGRGVGQAVRIVGVRGLRAERRLFRHPGQVGVVPPEAVGESHAVPPGTRAAPATGCRRRRSCRARLRAPRTARARERTTHSSASPPPAAPLREARRSKRLSVTRTPGEIGHQRHLVAVGELGALEAIGPDLVGKFGLVDLPETQPARRSRACTSARRRA